MEVTFSGLKQKDVINLVDGKNLGKVCDLSFTFPESDVTGFTVTGSKGFKWSKQELFLPIDCVVKIGDDAVLVKYGKNDPPPPKPKPPHNCPPPSNNCPPNNCLPKPPFDRRNYDEYE